MKKTPAPQNAGTSALDKRNSNTAKFSGTDNPRHFRAIDALNTRPMPREHLDRRVGCSNSPELVAELRRRGLEVPCERIPDTDRDGLPIRRGVYAFTEQDRRKVRRWLASRQKGIIDATLAGLLALALVCAGLLMAVAQ